MRSITVPALLALIAGSASGQLVNPMFETPGVGTLFAGWDQFNGGLLAETEVPIQGAASAGMFGDFSGFFNNKGYFQNVSGVVPGDEWIAQIDGWHLEDDALEFGADAVLSLVFVDTDVVGIGANVYDAQGVTILDSTTPVTSEAEANLQTVSISAIAPLNVDEAQIVLVFNQQAPTMDDNMDGTIGAGDGAAGRAILDNAILERVSSGNDIPFYNGSFEEGVFSRAFNGWNQLIPNGGFGQLFPNNIFPFETPDALDGDQVAFMFGQFIDAVNVTFIDQALPAAPGQDWTASVEARHASGDAIAGGNVGILSLQFLDASGAVIDDNGINTISAADATDTWFPFEVSATAPAGTAQARIFLGYEQDDVNSGGAIWYDAASLAQATGPQRACADVDDNGSVSPADFTAWLALFNNPNPTPDEANRADVNQDGSVTPADFTAWLGFFNNPNNDPGCP